MAETFQYDVFIIHTLDDKAAEADLTNLLTRDKLRVWNHGQNFELKEPMDGSASVGLMRSRTIMLLASARAMATSGTRKMIEHLISEVSPLLEMGRQFIVLKLNHLPKPTLPEGAVYLDWSLRSYETSQEILKLCQPTQDDVGDTVWQHASEVASPSKPQVYESGEHEFGGQITKLSPAIVELRQVLSSEDSIGAFYVMNALLEKNPTLGSGLARVTQYHYGPETENRRSRTVDEWFFFVAILYDLPAGHELNSHLVALGLMVLEEAFWHWRETLYLARALAEEHKPPPRSLLSVAGRETIELSQFSEGIKDAFGISGDEPETESTQRRILYKASEDASTDETGAGVSKPPDKETVVKLGTADMSSTAPELTVQTSSGDKNPDESLSGTHSASDAVPTLDDRPATVDELGRESLASYLATRIRTERGMRSGGPFRALIYAPWGAGKTSLLNLISAKLEVDVSKEQGTDKTLESRKWVVVEFNAWQHQHVGPPWWSLMARVYQSAMGQVSWGRRRWLWIWQRLWPFLMGKSSYIVAVLTFGLLALLAGTVLRHWQVEFSDYQSIIDPLESFTTILGIAASLWALAFGLSKTLLLGSSQAARKFVEGALDPYARISRHYDKLIKRINLPVAVFIDDIDRCKSKYAVDLLEGIQTVCGRSQVTYIVASDRRWLSICFESQYPEFREELTETGRRFGYLFVEKTFQIIAQLPRIGPVVRERYVRSLLDLAPEVAEGQLRKKAQEFQKLARERSTEEDLRAIIDDVRDDPVLSQLAQNAVAARQADSDFFEKDRHFLTPYFELLDANPRAMKHLVNTYGMRKFLNTVAGNPVRREKLALWTVLSLRWPELALFLEGEPAAIEKVTESKAKRSFPEPLRPLVGHKEVKLVVNGEGPLGGPLTTSDIRAIVLQQEAETDSTKKEKANSSSGK